MRVFALATAAALAAAAWAPAPAAAQNFKAEVIQKTCSDMTFNQIGEGLADLVQKYEFSSNPEEAEQQAIGLLCPSSVASAEEPQPEAAEEPKSEATQANLVQEASMPPHRLPPAPLPHLRPPPPRMLPPQVSIPRLPPPPPGGYGRHRPPPARAMASVGGYRERYHYEEHYRSRGPRRLPLTSSARGEPYCMAETDPERFVREFPAPHAACEIGPIPNKPCPGWVCHRR
jgi:hypothetical protein